MKILFKVMGLIANELLAIPKYLFRGFSRAIAPSDAALKQLLESPPSYKRVWVYSDEGFVFANLTEEQLEKGEMVWVYSDRGWVWAWL